MLVVTRCNEKWKVNAEKKITKEYFIFEFVIKLHYPDWLINRLFSRYKKLHRTENVLNLAGKNQKLMTIGVPHCKISPNDLGWEHNIFQALIRFADHLCRQMSSSTCYAF